VSKVFVGVVGPLQAEWCVAGEWSGVCWAEMWFVAAHEAVLPRTLIVAVGTRSILSALEGIELSLRGWPYSAACTREGATVCS
jgi:hypothetical protein